MGTQWPTVRWFLKASIACWVCYSAFNAKLQGFAAAYRSRSASRHFWALHQRVFSQQEHSIALVAES